MVNKFKCFYREKNREGKNEWVQGHLLLTKTHLYGLIQPAANSKASKGGMVKIAVRHPLNSVIKIATKSSCPEIISFTYGEKLASTSKSLVNNSAAENLEETTRIEASESAPAAQLEYDIKGKDWFFIPDYAGEAASAVKMRILEIADLIS